MDQMFDLDMALTMPTMAEDSSANVTKLSEASRAFNQNQLREMPMVAAVGECTVCMESFESIGGKQVPCGHIFHSTCISHWLSLHDSCPLCRTKVFASAEDLR